MEDKNINEFSAEDPKKQEAEIEKRNIEEMPASTSPSELDLDKGSEKDEKCATEQGEGALPSADTYRPRTENALNVKQKKRKGSGGKIALTAFLFSS